MSRILIVEDDADIAELERNYLEASSFATIIASDGRRGLALALGDGFDLVILDLMLPGEDGLSVCRSIRERSDIPVVMVTAYAEDIDVMSLVVVAAMATAATIWAAKRAIPAIKGAMRSAAPSRGRRDARPYRTASSCRPMAIIHT